MEPGVFAGLVTDDKVGKVVKGIEAAILQSFQEDVARTIIISPTRGHNITHAETKHRAELCVKAFRELRGDLKWSVERCLDELPRMLRSKLDGTKWEPVTSRNSWCPPVAGDMRK